MGKVETYKGVISSFISSEKGQRFFNFAYSIGAAIVIWGALFKILHLPGGNMLLSIGMGTEVMMFVLTAFDRPPKEYKWEDVFPALRGEEDAEVRGGLGGVGGGTVVVGDAQQGTHAGAGLPVDVNAARHAVVYIVGTPVPRRDVGPLPKRCASSTPPPRPSTKCRRLCSTAIVP